MAEQGRQPIGPDGMTIKQRRWLKLYIKTGNATEAAAQVYDCKDRESASSVGVENLRKLRTNVAEAMEEVGLTVPYLLEKLQEGTAAELVEVVKHEGKITDEKAYVDFPTRHRYLDTLIKLLGAYAATKLEHTGPKGGPIEHFLTLPDEELDVIAGTDKHE